MTDTIKEQFDAIAERIGATRQASPAKPTTPTPTEHATVQARATTESRFADPGARRTIIVDDDPEGGLTRLETTAEYLNRLFATEVGAHSRPIGDDGHDGWVTLHLRWLYASDGIIGMAWVEASVRGTFGYWHLGERCGLANEAQLILSLEGQPVDAVTRVRASDWQPQCRAAIDALTATVARHAAARAR